MIFYRILFFSVFLSVLACNSDLKQQNLDLTETVDSLNTQLGIYTNAFGAMLEVDSILRTIEEERNIITLNAETGMSDKDYAERIENLNNLLEKAEERLANLEDTDLSSRRLIAKLRSDLDEQTKTVEFLEKVLDTMRDQNVTLKQALRTSEDEIYLLEKKIADKQDELSLLENEIMAMTVEAKKSEAEAYYARAVAYEEAANRTKLAPRKKKETLAQALELYQKALDMGYEEARSKVEELETTIK